MYVAQKLNLAVETRSSKVGFETSKSRETDDGWVSLILTRGRPGDFHLGKEGRSSLYRLILSPRVRVAERKRKPHLRMEAEDGSICTTADGCRMPCMGLMQRMSHNAPASFLNT